MYPMRGRFPLVVGGVQWRVRVWEERLVTEGLVGEVGFVGGAIERDRVMTPNN